MSEDQEPLPPIEIPIANLSEEALTGVIDNFFQREGTDYGAVEISYETKMQQIRRQIEKGQIKIVFDPNTESVTLMTLLEWKKYAAHAQAPE